MRKIPAELMDKIRELKVELDELWDEMNQYANEVDWGDPDTWSQDEAYEAWAQQIVDASEALAQIQEEP